MNPRRYAKDFKTLSLRVIDSVIVTLSNERTPIVLICLDGCSWEYIRAADMQNLKKIQRCGTSIKCKSMIPTVTNVNNASILTGEFPIKHGITGNYYFDQQKDVEKYMDSWSFLKCGTLLEKASKKGFKTLLLTVKDKLKRLLSRGTTTSFSVEKPSEWILKKQGKPPSVYSSDSVLWLLDAALKMLEKRRYDITYISTTDYISHKYEPRSVEAKEYMEAVDDRIGSFSERGFIIGVTADHGMGNKSIKVNLRRILAELRINARIIPIIKDEFIEHHQNLGGAVYIYLSKGQEKARETLLAAEDVESVLTNKEAARLYKLPPDRIGDFLVLATKSAVFGNVSNGFREEIDIRSHGSLHESEVPFITNQKINVRFKFFNKDSLHALLVLRN